ncbi:MAG: hypothetical protein IJZ42_09250 [Lachnospiraceae bacterium]|nr:hypothetical protein [Lachnospiraceae bacterium]
MKKKIYAFMLVAIMSVVFLAGCADNTTEGTNDAIEQETDSAEGLTENSEEVCEEENNSTDNGEYAYLEEKGLSGEELEVAIAVNEYFGKVYEEQIVLWVEYSNCDKPIAVAIDISEFERIEYEVEPDYYDPAYVKVSTAYCLGLTADVEGDGVDELYYTAPDLNDSLNFTFDEYMEGLGGPEAAQYGIAGEDLVLFTNNNGRGNGYDLIWGHSNSPEHTYLIRPYYYTESSATAFEYLNADNMWLVDKITIVSTPDMVSE